MPTPWSSSLTSERVYEVHEHLGRAALPHVAKVAVTILTESRVGQMVFALVVTLLVGAIIGWFGGRAESQKPCRDEVISVEATHGPASCTYAEAAGELKDGYLICKCKPKK
jgi:hypothetical protein